MKKESKRVLQLLLWVLLGIVIIIVVGYFIYSWLHLNDKGITQDYFSEKTFYTQDGQTQLRFDYTVENATFRAETGSINYAVSDYVDNVFTFEKEDETLYFIVLDSQVMYGGSGIYLFLVGG